MATVVFNRRKSSGNIFYVLGMAFSSLLEEGRKEEAKAMCERVYQSSDYDIALNIIREYVELVEVNK